MREYTLNDIGFTPGKVEELPINFSVENTMNTDEINEQSQKNRQMGEELLRQFEERQKAEVVADVVMETTKKMMYVVVHPIRICWRL